jgi:hypothetical protein
VAKERRDNPFRYLAIGVSALLILSALQLFIGAKNYELDAREAHAMCLQSAKQSDRSECQALLPFWEREDGFGTRSVSTWLVRTSDRAIEFAVRRAEAFKKMLDRRRLRQAYAPAETPTRTETA